MEITRDMTGTLIEQADGGFRAEVTLPNSPTETMHLRLAPGGYTWRVIGYSGWAGFRRQPRDLTIDEAEILEDLPLTLVEEWRA